MTVPRFAAVTFFLFPAVTLFVLNCAEVAPPPGGEEDRLSPTIVETSPVNGSINVFRSREITFWFSEGIIRPIAARPVFISPRQAAPPKLKWKTDRLIVTLANDFDSNQTYVVTLSAEITDWRRNKMDSTVTIAFSTGDKIDSGSVGGFITALGKPKSGILAGLYELSDDSAEIDYDSAYPNYTTQSATDGSFKFKFLPKMKFLLVAFEDSDRNERYNAKIESFAVADRKINTGSSTFLDELYLEMSGPKKKELTIASAFYTADGLIKIRFNRKTDLGYLKHHLNLITFSSISDPSRIAAAQAVLESHLDTSSVLTVYPEKIDTGSYVISLVADSGALPVRFEGLTIGELKDKNPPVLIKFSPTDQPHFKDKIDISALFSEPIDETKVTSGTFLLTSAGEQDKSIQTTWPDPFHAALVADSLNEGERYSMSIAEFEIADLSGNVLGDSIKSFGFSSIDSDSLGSITGTVKVEFIDKMNSTKQLTFTSVSGNQSFDIKVLGNAFSMELPAGKYLMSGYLDENNNGYRDLGSTKPYTLAETFGKSADTIFVRARFETAGIEFKFK